MSQLGELESIERAVAVLRERLGPARTAGLRLGMVLGSGLKGFVRVLQEPLEIPFRDVPGWPQPLVEGHGASLVVGTVSGLGVACLSGRVHLYEGWRPNDVVRAVRTLRRLPPLPT